MLSSPNLTAMSFVSFASFWYTIGPRFTLPGVYLRSCAARRRGAPSCAENCARKLRASHDAISGIRLSGSIRQLPTSTPSNWTGGARPPVEIWMTASGSRSLISRTVSRNLSTRIVGRSSSLRAWMCSTDTPALMHSCMSSAISFGVHGRLGLLSRVLMFPVVASVITSLPWSRVSCDARPSGPWFHLRSSALPSDSPHFIEGAASRDDASFEFVGSGGAERSALGAERSDSIAVGVNSMRCVSQIAGSCVPIGPSFELHRRCRFTAVDRRKNAGLTAPCARHRSSDSRCGSGCCSSRPPPPATRFVSRARAAVLLRRRV